MKTITVEHSYTDLMNLGTNLKKGVILENTQLELIFLDINGSDPKIKTFKQIQLNKSIGAGIIEEILKEGDGIKSIIIDCGFPLRISLNSPDTFLEQGQTCSPEREFPYKIELGKGVSFFGDLHCHTTLDSNPLRKTTNCKITSITSINTNPKSKNFAKPKKEKDSNTILKDQLQPLIFTTIQIQKNGD